MAQGLASKAGPARTRSGSASIIEINRGQSLAQGLGSPRHQVDDGNDPSVPLGYEDLKSARF